MGGYCVTAPSSEALREVDEQVNGLYLSTLCVKRGSYPMPCSDIGTR